ncbi:MAG: hypothetical protein MOB07_23675 [Acidobacteria bacterium]|nr:hypothetical protein [Acidobacteriota bacterium]
MIAERRTDHHARFCAPDTRHQRRRRQRRQNRSRARPRGPLAVDELYNPGIAPVSAIALISQQLQLKTSVTYRDADGFPAYETAAIVTPDTEKYRAGEMVTLRLVPFASAGAYGNHFSVWLRRPK